MADVHFTEEATLAPTPAYTKSASRWAAWLVRAKWAKDEKQAEYLLIGVVIVALVAAVAVPLLAPVVAIQGVNAQ